MRAPLPLSTERAGLILTIYNPSRAATARTLSSSTATTGVSMSASSRHRQHPLPCQRFSAHCQERSLPGRDSTAMLPSTTLQPTSKPSLESGYAVLRQRCTTVQTPQDQARSLLELERVRQELEAKWGQNPDVMRTNRLRG